MSLITKVKAGSVSSLSDARFFAGLGVDWLGFDVNPQSDNYVSVEHHASMAGWVSGPKRVIELSSLPSDSVMEKLVADYAPDFVQVNLNDVPEIKRDIPLFALALAEALDVDFLKTVADKIDYLIVDLGGAHPFDQRPLLSQLAEHTKILMSVAPEITDIKKIIAELPIAGLSLKGSKELKTGIKEYDYADLLESLDVEA